ncbi:MAG: hypothetical protein KC496_05285 [Anaerolineae bacterium]|nr:hypothetical protein [Anaerolineae bacterium]
MSKPERTPLETAALAVYYHAAQLLQDGKSHAEIEAKLVQQGIRREQAQMILQRLEQSRMSVARGRGRRHIFLGLVLVGLLILPLFGIGVPAVTGGQLVIALILLGCGLYILGRGLFFIARSTPKH